MLAFKLNFTHDSWWLAMSKGNFRHGKIDKKGDDILRIRRKHEFKALTETPWKKSSHSVS